MVSTEEYRKYADECADWAKTAKSQRERDIFLQMALAWWQAATIAALARAQTNVPKPSQAACMLGAS